MFAWIHDLNLLCKGVGKNCIFPEYQVKKPAINLPGVLWWGFFASLAESGSPADGFPIQGNMVCD